MALGDRADRRGRGRRLAAAVLLGALGIGGTLPVEPAGALPADEAAAPQITAQPVSPAPSASPSWSFRVPSAAGVTCAFGPAGAVPVPQPCTSPYTARASADGPYVLVLDSGGARVTLPYVRDSVTAVRLDGPVGPSQDRAPSWRLELEPGARATCRLDDGVAQACADTWTVDLADALPGEHHVEVEAVDQAGNRAVERRSYVLAPAGEPNCSTCNTAAPPALPCSTCNSTAAASAIAVQGPVGPSRDPDPVFRVTGTGRTAECRVLRGDLPLRPWTPCGAEVRLGLTEGDRDGNYVLQARESGRGTPVSSAPYRYDLTAPDRVRVDGTSGGTSLPEPWTWQPQPETSSLCTLLRDDAVVAGPVACTPGQTPRPDRDGVHSLRVALVDGAGNVGPEASSPEVLVDTTPPAAPVVLVSPSGGTAHQALVSAHVEPGATTSCRWVGAGGAGVLGPRGLWTPCRLPVSVDLAEVPAAGTHVEVRATDAAGLTGPAGAAPLVPQEAAPPAVTGPTGPSPLRRPTLDVLPTGAPEDLVCRLVHGGSADPWAPCRGSVVLDLTDRRDGAYTLEATGTRSGLTGRATYVLDTQPPLPPVLTVEPARIGSDDVLSWQWREEAGVSYRCRLTGPTAPLADGPCGSGVRVDLTGQPDGLWTFSLTATDAAGLTTERTVEHLLDRRVPALGVLPAAPAGERHPRWSVATADDLVAVCTLLRDSAPVRGPEACGDTWGPALDDQPDGVLQLQVRTTGADGLTAVHVSDHLLDTVAPAVRVGLPAAGSDRAPVADVAADDPTAAVSCRLQPGDWQPCGTPTRLDLTGRSDGPSVLEVRATDAAGRETTATATYLLDTTAPEPVPVRTSSAPGDPLTSWSVGEPEPGARLVCTLTTAGGPTTTDCSPPAFTAGPALADQPLVLSVVAVDAAGNRSAPTAAAASPDRTAPQLRAPVPDQGPVGRERSVRWTFLAEPGSTTTCTTTLDGAVQRVAPCTSPFVLDLPAGAPDGTFGLVVVATDAAGNRSPAVSGSHLLDTAAPAAPVFTATPAGPSGLPLLRWSVQAGAGDTVTCQLLRDGRPLEAPRPCAGTQDVDLRVLERGPGSYALRAWARDPAGSTSPPVTSRPYAWVREGGLGVLWHAAPEGHLARATGAWVFSAEPGASLSCALLRDGEVVRPRSRCDGSYPVAGLHRSGFYTLQVTASLGGESSAVPSERSFTLELEDPAAPRLVQAPPAAGRSPHVSWAWAAPSGRPVQCRLLRTGAAPAAWADCAGGTLRTVLPAEGVWRLELRTVALSGRTSPVTASPGHTYDATPPEVPALRLRPSSGTVGTATEAVWSFALPAGTTGRCTVLAGGRAAVPERACRDGLVLDLRDRPPGDHVLTLVVADAAGNTATATSTFVLLPPPARPVGALTPSDRGPARPVLPARAPLSAPARHAERTAARLPAVPVVPGVPEPAVPLPAAGGGASGAGGETQQGPAGATSPGAPGGRGRDSVPGVPGPLDLALRDVLADTLSRPTLPLTLLVVVMAFLLVQNRLDRRDPKLAAAPVAPPAPLPFGPAVRGDARDSA